VGTLPEPGVLTWIGKKFSTARDLTFGTGVTTKVKRAYRMPPPKDPWAEPQHESLRGIWWLAEFFPKRRWNSDLNRCQIRIGLGGRRTIKAGAQIHKSALRRIIATAYAPPNLSPQFLDKVQKLDAVPETLAYDVQFRRRLPDHL
jgi:hypothetical protein